ncbi:MAG: universal stress protein [Chloroflexi bacterium]|nr:universal stress protein [Chloroflexota bacterium]
MAFQKILIPLDGSALAERALPYASAIARAKNCEVILFSVGAASPDLTEKPMRAYLWDRAKEMSVPGASVKTEVVFGNAAEEIIKFAEKNKADLIIISSHGYSGIKRWVMGSVAHKVLSSTVAPVLLLKSKSPVIERVEVRKVLVPLDGSTLSEASIPYVEDLAALTGAEVILLRVVEPLLPPTIEFAAAVDSNQTYRLMQEEEQVAEQYLGNLKDKLSQRGLKVKSKIVVGKAADSIVDVADQENVNLITMTTRGRLGLSRFVYGSVTSKVHGEARQPVLLINPLEKPA